jgi:hypothetical protein
MGEEELVNDVPNLQGKGQSVLKFSKVVTGDLINGAGNSRVDCGTTLLPPAPLLPNYLILVAPFECNLPKEIGAERKPRRFRLWLSLFVAQGVHGVSISSATGGDVAGE